MPLVDDVKGYAHSASSQGKAALNQVNTVLHTATERITAAVDEAPRPDHLALGAAEVGAEALTRYAEAAARRARDRVAKRPRDAAAARAAARKAVEAYFDNASRAYAAVSARGEARAASLSADDLMTKLRDELATAPGAVRARLEPALQSLLTSTIEAVSAQIARPAKPSAGATAPHAGSPADTSSRTSPRPAAKAGPTKKPGAAGTTNSVKTTRPAKASPRTRAATKKPTV